MGAGQRLYRKAKRLIPGGTQLLSKRPEMMLPDQWPAYYAKAKGCNVWDLDGNVYADMSYMGIGACVLGYADPDVNAAVKRAVDAGNMTTLNCPEEVELAEKLVALHPWADQARFARTGGEACAIAVRIARAAAGKDEVLFCGYHGWSDWYLAANIAHGKNLEGQLLPGLEPKGVPRALAGSATPFHYGDLDDFIKKFDARKSKLAAVIMEPGRSRVDVDFLKAVRARAKRAGVALIFDEVTSGFRSATGGMHLLYPEIEAPDMIVLGKGLGNGFPISAVLGREKFIRAAQTTFISSTYWTERVGFAAALEVIRQFTKRGVPAQLRATGERLHKELQTLLDAAGVPATVGGLTPLPAITFKHKEPLLIKTVFTQEMLKKGFLATNGVYAAYTHSREDVTRYLRAAGAVFETIGKDLRRGNLEKRLKGPVCHGGFKRLT